MDILVYAIIAVFLAWRLYLILGQRHEDGRERPNPFALREGKDIAAKPDPGAPPARLPAPDEFPDPAAAFRAEPAPDSLAGGLYAIRRADPFFDEKNFLKGARVAFEMVVQGFIAAERATLKNLMAPPVFASFEKALDEREARGERFESNVLALKESDITAARMVGSVALVTVQFVSDQSKRVFDKDGNLKQEAATVERLTDLWTFRRDTRDANPNWQLIETRSI